MDWKHPNANGRVTVVIPTYNRAALVVRAVRSVLAQTRSDLCDIVVVDDGSTDATAAHVGAFGPRVTYLRRPQRGAGAARNAAIRACVNEFVAFLDSDDTWVPDKLERQLAALARWPEASFVAGRSIGHDPAGRECPRPLPTHVFDRPLDFAAEFFEGCYVDTPTVLVRTALLRRTGLFRPYLRRAQDYEFFVRMACHGRGVMLDRVLAHVAVGAAHGLSRRVEAQLLNTVWALYLLRRELVRRPDCRPAWTRGVVRCLTELCHHARRARRFAAAGAYGLLALAHAPVRRAPWEWRRCTGDLGRALAALPERAADVARIVAARPAVSSGERT